MLPWFFAMLDCESILETARAVGKLSTAFWVRILIRCAVYVPMNDTNTK